MKWLQRLVAHPPVFPLIAIQARAGSWPKSAASRGVKFRPQPAPEGVSLITNEGAPRSR